MRYKGLRKPSRFNFRSCVGFTLLEVLVALMIIGISLGATFQAVTQSKRISWRSDEVMEAVRIAHNILSDFALIETAIERTEIDENVSDEKGWRYRLTVSPLELRTENAEDLVDVPSMVKLQLCLVHQSGQREKPFCLTRWYRFRS